VCELIIDGGSCTNVASTILIDKIQLATTVHSTPYFFQWLKQGSEVTVSKQTLIKFLVSYIVVKYCVLLFFLWMHVTCSLVDHDCLVIM